MSESLTVALWATNLALPLTSLADWAARVDARLAEAKAQGAALLVMPEYLSEQWLSFAPAGLALAEEIPWMAGQAPAALAALRSLVARHQIALLAGTMPAALEDPEPGRPAHRNRAWLLLPDGREIAQDKLVLTPSEKHPQGWNLATGDSIAIVEWRGLRLATLVCLDVEMPALSSLLAPQALDLLLVPSMTESLSGYSRVFACAKARAIELQAVVCAVGCIGKASVNRPRASNVSGAAVYVPCEPGLGHGGIHAQIPPTDRVEGPGPLLIARDLPIRTIRTLRAGGAEVWPGAWRADHVRLGESLAPAPARTSA